MVRLLVPLLGSLLSAAAAQHGTAEAGYYPFGYNGDTWTGHVASTNSTTREIKLVYVRGDKEESFVGVLKSGYTMQRHDGAVFEIRGKDGSKLELDPGQVPLGTRLVAYYMVKKVKQGDAKTKTNEIFLIRLLPDDGSTFTGVVASTNEAIREITLRDPQGSGSSFIGVLAEGYRFEKKDGTLDDLKASEISAGMNISVYYVTEKRKAGEKKYDVNRIYRIKFLREPDAQ